MDKTIEQQARELKSCPWCHPYGSPMPQFMDAGYWAVLCGCGAEGPVRDTESEAITAWNTRPAPTEAEVEAAVRKAIAAVNPIFRETLDSWIARVREHARAALGVEP